MFLQLRSRLNSLLLDKFMGRNLASTELPIHFRHCLISNQGERHGFYSKSNGISYSSWCAPIPVVRPWQYKFTLIKSAAWDYAWCKISCYLPVYCSLLLRAHCPNTSSLQANCHVYYANLRTYVRTSIPVPSRLTASQGCGHVSAKEALLLKLLLAFWKR
mgnify:CR=1 FL=1